MSQYVLHENEDGSTMITQKDKIMAEVCGKVSYVNPKNRKLFAIHAEQMNKKFRCVLSYRNPFCPVKVGDAIYGIAEYTKDKRYGDTLNIIQPPFVIVGEDKNTIIDTFVNSLRGKGFGPVKANNLYDLMLTKYGSIPSLLNTLDQLSSYYYYEKNKDTSILIPFTPVVKEKQMLVLLKYWYKSRNLRRLYLLGINNKEIRGTRMAPEEIYLQCLENPYVILSLPLDKCDDIMNRMGKSIDPLVKKSGEIYRKLKEFVGRGWTSVPIKILVNIYPDLDKYITTLFTTFGLKEHNGFIYLPYQYEVETGICDMVKDLLDGPNLPNALHRDEIQYTRPDLTEEQKAAIHQALSENISIITGIAGSGKTTVIKEIIHNLRENRTKYKVVSFTGKAVARIREVIEHKEPMTMHLTITMSKEKKANEFSHLIIDEASMVTSELLYQFISKFNHDYRITLIGDAHQLTPIGGGTMFEKMIESEIIPTYHLTTCHRTGDNAMSGILINANNIVECSDPDYNGPLFDFVETEDFKILEGDITVVGDLMKILQDCGIPQSKLTVISPYNKYLPDVNGTAQKIYNSTNRSVTDTKGTVWRIKDRVMMVENNYKYNIMNGDEGTITDVSVGEVQVTFNDGTSHVFSISCLSDDTEEGYNPDSMGSCKSLTTDHLVHSFGVTVHRYQGSEADFIILYIPKEERKTKFLNRNLLYTGITRAKQIIWMVGDYETMKEASTTAPGYRCDNLATRLKDMMVIKM
jgi:hypothetical protein